jgi:His/Glu/Gln/Arg/opine family amino acid ABC transporter permease subunit
MNFSLIMEYADFILTGAVLTIFMALGSIALGCILGTILGLMRVSSSRFLKLFSGAYLQVFRGTPMLLQIFFIFFAIPQIYNMATGNFFNWRPEVAGVIALGMNSGAYIAEIIRSGIQGVDIGQTEAARALGLTHRQTMQLVILPQALRRVVPPLCNEFIVLLKDTSLVSGIGAKELMYRSRSMGVTTYDFVSFLVGAAAVYFVLTFILTQISNLIERRLAVSD